MCCFDNVLHLHRFDRGEGLASCNLVSNLAKQFHHCTRHRTLYIFTHSAWPITYFLNELCLFNLYREGWSFVIKLDNNICFFGVHEVVQLEEMVICSNYKLVWGRFRHVALSIEYNWTHKAVIILRVYIECVFIHVLDPNTAIIFFALHEYEFTHRVWFSLNMSLFDQGSMSLSRLVLYLRFSK